MVQKKIKVETRKSKIYIVIDIINITIFIPNNHVSY